VLPFSCGEFDAKEGNFFDFPYNPGNYPPSSFLQRVYFYPCPPFFFIFSSELNSSHRRSSRCLKVLAASDSLDVYLFGTGCFPFLPIRLVLFLMPGPSPGITACMAGVCLLFSPLFFFWGAQQTLIPPRSSYLYLHFRFCAPRTT